MPKKDKTVFGVPIERVLELRKEKAVRGVPSVIVDCCEYLSKHGLRTEGIFRVSGNEAEVNKFVNAYNSGKKVDLHKAKDEHVVSTLLKRFLRKLPVPLLPKSFTNQTLRWKDEQPEVRAIKVKELVKGLPEDVCVPIEYVFRFLYKVKAQESFTKMSSAALGIVFGPCLVHTQESDAADLEEVRAANDLISLMIDYCEAIFDGKDVSAVTKSLAPPKKIGKVETVVPQREQGSCSYVATEAKEEPRGVEPSVTEQKINVFDSSRDEELVAVREELTRTKAELKKMSKRNKTEMLSLQKENEELTQELSALRQKNAETESKWSRDYQDLKRSSDAHVALLEARLRGDDVEKCDDSVKEERHFVCGDLSLCIKEGDASKEVIQFLDGLLQKIQILQSAPREIGVSAIQGESTDRVSQNGETSVISGALSQSHHYSKEVASKVGTIRARIEGDVERVEKLAQRLESLRLYLSES